MSFGEGDLHVKAAKLQERVDSLEVTNGKLCAEINRQERVIEEQRRLIANRDELVRDLLREAWVVQHDDPFYAGYREIGQRPTFEQRASELGIEVN